MTPQRGKSRKQSAAIAALLTTSTIAEAAATVGICQRTLLRWLSKNEDFAAAYREAQKQLLEQAINNLRQAASTFTQTLRVVAEDVTAPPGSRAQAARSGLEVLLRACSLEDLERRLSELERAASTIERRR